MWFWKKYTIFIVDRINGTVFCSEEIDFGRNLLTDSNQNELNRDLERVIQEGYKKIPPTHYLKGIAFSSHETEDSQIKANVQKALDVIINEVQKRTIMASIFPPRSFIVNEEETLLHSADIVLLADKRTRCVAKVKKEHEDDSGEYTIYNVDGNDTNIKPISTRETIAKAVLLKFAEIERTGCFTNCNRNLITFEPKDSYLRALLFEKVFYLLGIDPKQVEKAIKDNELDKYLELVYSGKRVNGTKYDADEINEILVLTVEEAASGGDQMASSILNQTAIGLAEKIKDAYEIGKFGNNRNCIVLLSGGMLSGTRMMGKKLMMK